MICSEGCEFGKRGNMDLAFIKNLTLYGLDLDIARRIDHEVTKREGEGIEIKQQTWFRKR